MAEEGREARVVEILVQLADSLRSGYDVVDTMDLLVHSSTSLTSAIAGGVMLADANGVLHVVASTSERTSDVEEAQLGADEGPCLDSYHAGTVVDVPDIAASAERWPAFAAIAAERGYKSAVAVPLRLRGQALGGVNLFFDRLGTLSYNDAALVEAMTQIAAISIVQQRTIEDQATVRDQLQRALDGRVIIEQAKGVIAQRKGLPIDGAFSVLRNYARSNNSRLREVAEKVVTHELDI